MTDNKDEGETLPKILCEPSEFALPTADFKQRFDRLSRRAGIADRQHFASGWAQRKQSLYDRRFEARIGTDNFLPFGVLRQASTLGRAVCKIEAEGVSYNGFPGAWNGTGFLVAPGLLLTNHHVLNSKEVAQSASAIFDYHADGENAGQTTTVALDPKSLFITSQASGGLDYTFVALKEPADGFGAIQMYRGAFATDFMKRANIIQHPDGRPKEVVLQDNQVLPDDHPLFLHYVTDTEGGSSGSPVFDNNWQLKALHHASRRNLEQELPVGSEGTPPKRLNEGVKISAIAADLELRLDSEDERDAASKVLAEIKGEDSFTGFFGVRGRGGGAQEENLEAVIETYYGKERDIDIAFWNIEWFNRHYRKKLGKVAGIVADLKLDIWAFSESSPQATRALAARMRQEFGQRYECLASEPEASEHRQTTTVMWNSETVSCVRVPWPDKIAEALRAHSEEFDEIEMEAVEGKIFNRFPGLFHFTALSSTPGTQRPFDFFLVPLHLKAKAEGKKRRRMASSLLAEAIDIMQKQGHDQDWVLGGDFNAELKSGDFDPLSVEGFQALSAADEESGALTYLSPRFGSLIDHIFLSPNMAAKQDSDFFILAADKRIPEFDKEISDHRPVIARLSLTGEAPAEADERVEALLRAYQNQPAALLRALAAAIERQAGSGD
ncbi:MAG: trypsin-like peptidase domain-containing protein [Kiloniellales bacterium]|nr:trypsin-like peptidase domain-containing protein [Kiloniellales bacterium]